MPSTSRIHPPWIKTKTSRNVARRARLAAIERRRIAIARATELAAIADAARRAR